MRKGLLMTKSLFMIENKTINDDKPTYFIVANHDCDIVA